MCVCVIIGDESINLNQQIKFMLLKVMFTFKSSLPLSDIRFLGIIIATNVTRGTRTPSHIKLPR